MSKSSYREIMHAPGGEYNLFLSALGSSGGGTGGGRAEKCFWHRQKMKQASVIISVYRKTGRPSRTVFRALARNGEAIPAQAAA